MLNNKILRVAALCFTMALMLCGAALGEEERPITLRFSEVMASNQSYHILPNELTPDWLELENYGAEPIALDGLWLTDSKKVLNKYIFPENTVLQPGEFMVIYAADVEGEINGVTSVAFKLKSEGETVSIYMNGVLVDQLKYGELEGDTSYALGDDGAFHVTSTPTIGEKNVITALEE